MNVATDGAVINVWTDTTRPYVGRILSRCQGRRDDALYRHAGEGEFDELVVGQWLHIEWLDEHVWWMRVGDVRLTASVQPDGKVVVDVERGCYAAVRGSTGVYAPPGQ